MGEGIGLTGRAYAIPTKDLLVDTLPLNIIKPHISVFFDFAVAHPHWQFLFTHIGCGLAGYDWDDDIFPMLPWLMPDNVKVLDPI
jgi:hypothetical protein